MRAIYLASAASFALAGIAQASVTTMTFEGLADLETIGNYYNGGFGGSGSGPGPAYGVQWVTTASAVRSTAVGGSGAFVNEPSPSTVMDFLTTTGTTMNVPGGFGTGFAISYSSTYATGSISVFDGINGTGSLLGSAPLAALGSDPLGGGIPGAYNRWSLVGIPFSGTAHSVVFLASDFDAMTFDNATIGSTVPAPASATLLGLGGLVAMRRRR